MNALTAGSIVALGLASMPHCMGMCGPVAAAAGPGEARYVYGATRLAAYTAVGAGAAWLVGRFVAPSWLDGLQWVVALATAGYLVVLAARLLRGGESTALIPASRLTRGRRPRLALAAGLGAITALLPCGALYAALAVAAQTGEAGQGALAMLGFAAVTSPALFASQWASGVLRESLAGRRVLATTLVLAAVLVVGRVSMADEPAPCHTPASATVAGGAR